MDSIIRLDPHRQFRVIAKDNAWRTATLSSIQSNSDVVLLRPRHDTTLLTTTDLDETLLENDEIMDVMTKVTGHVSIREEFLWKDKGLKELLTKCRLDNNQTSPKTIRPLGCG